MSEAQPWVAAEERHKTRLLWLIDSMNVGGAERLVIPFVRSIDRERYDVHVCCLTTINDNPFESELRSLSTHFVNLGARSLRDIGAFRRLLRYVREEQIELMHSHLTYASIWGALASRLTHVPAVATLHVAPPQRGADKLRDRLLRFVLNRWAARVITVSDALRKKYVAGGGIRDAKFITVHNGIEVERFRRDADKSRAFVERTFDLPAGAPIVVTVSVLRAGKGIETLLEAIAQVPRAQFLIVGDGAMRDAWGRLAEQRGIADRVRWAGHRDDVDAILPGCDLFVLPSLDDAFPTVLLEAMAAGLPVVATRVGGIPEIVADDVTGRLVPPGNAAMLADCINDLLTHRETASRMRDAGRFSALRNFSTAAWLARLDRVYTDVLR